MSTLSSTSQFEEFVKERAAVGLFDHDYNFLGLCGESGECAEWWKKIGHRKGESGLTQEDLLLELGDVLHYLTRISLSFGWTLDRVMEGNVEKLTKKLEAKNE